MYDDIAPNLIIYGNGRKNAEHIRLKIIVKGAHLIVSVSKISNIEISNRLRGFRRI